MKKEKKHVRTTSCMLDVCWVHDKVESQYYMWYQKTIKKGQEMIFKHVSVHCTCCINRCDSVLVLCSFDWFRKDSSSVSEEKMHDLFPSQCIWILGVSSQSQVIVYLCFSLLSEQELAMTKLSSFHSWQAMCLALIEPHFHLLKWKAHGKSHAPGSDQLLRHPHSQSLKTEKRDSSVFLEKI